MWRRHRDSKEKDYRDVEEKRAWEGMRKSLEEMDEEVLNCQEVVLRMPKLSLPELPMGGGAKESAILIAEHARGCNS